MVRQSLQNKSYFIKNIKVLKEVNTSQYLDDHETLYIKNNHQNLAKTNLECSTTPIFFTYNIHQVSLYLCVFSYISNCKMIWLFILISASVNISNPVGVGP